MRPHTTYGPVEEASQRDTKFWSQKILSNITPELLAHRNSYNETYFKKTLKDFGTYRSPEGKHLFFTR